jgi:hypothetical protein
MVREVLQALLDAGVHRIIGLICLFALLGILVRLCLGLMSTGAKIAHLALGRRDETDIT